MGSSRASKESRAAYNKHWRETHPDRDAAMQRRNLLRRKYNITPEQFDEMLAAQQGRCAICRTSTPGGRWKQFVMDHCHLRNKNRAILCSDCNVGLGQFRDDPSLLRAAADYLDFHNRDEIG